MKKTNNKGFSLVELIIVIAIMAILAGAIAPALIRYIDKSRKSNDVTAAKSIKTAIETALGNESIYEFLTTGDDNYCYVYVTPGKSTATSDEGDSSSSATEQLDCITIKNAFDGEINGKSAEELTILADNEIGTNIGEKTPKLKYRKAAGKAGEPVEFVGVISKKGTVYVFISAASEGEMSVEPDETVGVKSDKGYQICPNVCDEYQ